jgi:hypothetical protein
VELHQLAAVAYLYTSLYPLGHRGLDFPALLLLTLVLPVPSKQYDDEQVSF